MVATQVAGATSQQRVTPYIGVDQFKYHRRRGVQATNLVPGGTPDQNDAALAEIIESASAWIDNLLPATLAATSDTVLEQYNVDRRGYLHIHPRFRPAIALTAVSVGPSGTSLTPFTDLSGCIVQPNRLTIPVAAFPLTTSQGPIQFGQVSAPMDQAWCQYTLQNGFPVTQLTAPALQGATSISVADTTGIVAGQTQLTIYDLQRRARFIAGTVSTASPVVGTGPGTVACSPLPWAIPNVGNYPTFVSNLPADVIEAVVLVIRAMIKETGAGNAASTARNPGTQASMAGDDYAEAEAMMHPYGVPIE